MPPKDGPSRFAGATGPGFAAAADAGSGEAFAVSGARAVSQRVDELRPELEAWRPPGIACRLGDATLTLRPALEFWPLVGDVEIDCGQAGTVMRFIAGLAGFARGDVMLTADESALHRPMGAMISTLRDVGVDIDDGGRWALPFTVRGRGHTRGGEVTIDASASSQFVSGLLLAAARYDVGLHLAAKPHTRHAGRALVQAMPHVLQILSGVGMAAMLWVGGHILLDGLHKLGWHAPLNLAHEAAHAVPHLLSWPVETLLSALAGLLAGALVVGAAHLIGHGKH